MIKLEKIRSFAIMAYRRSLFDGKISALSKTYENLVDGICTFIGNTSENSTLLAALKRMPDPIHRSFVSNALVWCADALSRKLTRTFFESSTTKMAKNILRRRDLLSALAMLTVSLLSVAALFWDTLPLRVPLVIAYVFIVCELGFKVLSLLIHGLLGQSDNSRDAGEKWI